MNFDIEYTDDQCICIKTWWCNPHIFIQFKPYFFYKDSPVNNSFDILSSYLVFSGMELYRFPEDDFNEFFKKIDFNIIEK